MQSTRRCCLRQAADGDGQSGRFGLGLAGHGDLGGAEPVEEGEGDCRDGQVDQEDDECLCGAVAVEVDRVAEQDVGVAGWQERADVTPERRKVRTPFAPPEEGLPNSMTTMTVTSVPAAPRSFCRTAATRATTATISERIGQTIQNFSRG